jgi:hypothetical protein
VTKVRNRQITIDRALTDPNLLGAALGNPRSWTRWLSVLKAAFALPLSATDTAAFQEVSGNREPPAHRVRELWCVVGRRGGKSRVAAACATYAACFLRHNLSRGEVGYVLVLAASRDQASVVFEYVKAFLEASPVLRQEIANVTAHEIRLRNGITIAIHANSFRSVRGRTLVACIFDEVSFWRDEQSATPDLEVYRAVLPALMTTRGTLVGISTPYRRVGLLHQKYRDYYGESSDDVLVVQGPSTSFNPTLTQAEIDCALADDPEGNYAEWLAEFRSDLSTFLSDELVDDAVEHGRPLELPPQPNIRYRGFCDPSGGRHDAYTLAIGHKVGRRFLGNNESARFVIDVVRGFKPPFDPMQVTRDYAALLKDYKVTEVIGDNYSAEWVTASFKEHGIRFKTSERPKSQLYLECLPLFTRAAVSLPDLPPLLKELRLLERQTHRSGRDSVDHPKRGSDDYANSLCGCLAHLGKPSIDHSLRWVGDEPAVSDGGIDWDFRRRSLWNHILTSGGFYR